MAKPGAGNALLLALGALILAGTAAQDARRYFDLLDPGTLLLVLLVSVALAVRSAWYLRAVAGRGRNLIRAAILFAAAAAALSTNALILHYEGAQIPQAWPSEEETRLNERATRLQEAFAEVLERLSEPVERARALAARQPRSGAPVDRARAFDVLTTLMAGRPSRDGRLAASLYGPGLQILAWSGPTHPAPREPLVLSIPEGSTKWLVVEEHGLSRIVALSRPWRDSSLLLLVETTLKSIYDRRVLSWALPQAPLQGDVDRVAFTDYRLPPLNMAALFEQQGDRLPATGTARPSLHVALRAPDRSLLGYATLVGRSLQGAGDDLYERHHRAAALVVVVSAAIVLGVSILPRLAAVAPLPWREIVVQSSRIAGIWVFRYLLLLFPLTLRLGGRNLDDPALFASAKWWGLSGSPQDFLLTALAVLATGVLVSVAATRLLLWSGSLRRRGAEICLAMALVIAFTLGLTVPSEAMSFVKNSRVDVLTVKPLHPSPARWILQIAAVVALMGLVLPLANFAWGAVWAAPPRRSREAPAPPLPTEDTLRWIALLLAPCALASCLILEIAIQPAATAVLREFLQENLKGLVRYAHLLRQTDLIDTLAAVESFPAIENRIASVPAGGDPTLAHDLWAVTPLAAKGYSASLNVLDPNGVLLSRFSRNFPPILDDWRTEPEDVEERTPVEFDTGPSERKVHALHIHTSLRRDGEPIGTVTIHLRDDFGDLPPLTPPTPLQEALGESRPLSSLLPPWARTIGLTVYDAQGIPVLAGPRDPPLPPPERARLLADFREKLWVTRDEAGVRTHELFFGSGDHLVALSFPEPGWINRIARVLKLAAQTVLCLIGLLTPWWLASAARLGWRLSPMHLLEALGRTHYRRLLTTFLMASLAPLTVLAVALTEYVTSEIEQDLVERGWTILESARRQVEDFAVIQGVEGPPDDAYFFNLSESVGESLSLFIDGELRAASDRELYSVGALPERLDDEVYRRIEVEGRRAALGQVRAGGRLYRTINGVVPLGLAGRGVLSILLAGQRVEVERRAQEVYDVLLLTTSSVILFMTVLAYVLARRIAAPIRRLSVAASRIAMGDLNAEVSAAARDETGDLVASFNAMARALRRQRDDLEQRGNYIEKILLNATTGVVSVDFRGRIVTLNPAAVSILGLPNLAAGQDLVARMSESGECAPLVRALRSCLGEPGLAQEVEAEIGPAGAARHARAHIVPFTEGAGLLIFLDDVTETIRSNRLAAWAEMARRIAHEIKNPLTPIQLSADHLKRVFADASPGFAEVLEECLRTIGEQVANLRGIAEQFSDYARTPEIRKEPTGMRAFLEDVIRPYRIAPPAGVSVECDLNGDLVTLDLDRMMMSQALVNLIENALQAMPDGGRLMMAASVAGTDRERMLQVLISDTGVGMDREALARVFEPYFSTKGSGTGLGMAIARRAVEEHRGRIEISSAPRKGTTAQVILPLP